MRCLAASLGCLFAAFLANSPVSAVTFDDGLVHVIDAANSYPFEEVIVKDGPGSATTTVTVVAGGEASGITASENSLVNVDGGNLTGRVYASDNVEVTSCLSVNLSL